MCILHALYLFFKDDCCKRSEAVYQRCSGKKGFLEIFQNSKEDTCVRVSFLIKLQALRPATLLKKRLWHSCFPASFEKFLKAPFIIKQLWWLVRNAVVFFSILFCFNY